MQRGDINQLMFRMEAQVQVLAAPASTLPVLNVRNLAASALV